MKVLIVEDESTDIRLLQETLACLEFSEVESEYAGSMAEAATWIQKAGFDVILLDLNLPDSKGLETLLKIRSLCPDAAIAVITGSLNEDLGLTALANGAQEYLVKGKFDVHLLKKSIQYAIQRKRGEQELLESEIRYRRLLESVTDYIYTVVVLDEKPVMTFHGESCVAVTGYLPEEYTANPNLWYEMIHEEDRGAVLEQAARIFKEGNAQPLEHRILHKDGSVRWVRNTIVVRRNGNGTIFSYDGLITDITERKCAEEALRRREESYRTLYKNTPSMMFSIDRQGRIVSVSRHWLDVMGYAHAEVVGRLFTDFLTSASRRYAETVVLPQFMETGHCHEIYYQFVTSRGETLDILMSAIAERDDSGNLVRFLVVLVDITKSRKIEGQLKQSLEKYQRIIEETIQALAITVEIRDPYTAGHQQRVSKLAEAIAKKMNLPEESIYELRLASIVHDIGKISVPAEILSKPGRLTEHEFGIIKTHARSGYEILRKIEFPWPIADIVLQHHERMNGSGYPAGLAGTSLFLESKILAVADVVEAMFSHRPYRASLGIGEALAEVSKNRNILYDGDVVDACLGLFQGQDFKFD